MAKYKYILTILLLIVFTSICLASEKNKKPPVVAEDEEYKKVEVGVLFGAGIPQFDFRNSISDHYTKYWYCESEWFWDWEISDWYYWYTEYNLTGSFSSSIVGESEVGFDFGGYFNYFFHKNFGFQFMAERSRHVVPIEASHNVDLSLYYYWGESAYYSAEPSIYASKGSLAVIPISFNAIARFDAAKNISGYASGGLTYYKADIEAESNAGYGFPFYWYADDSDLWYLWYDSALIPANIDYSLSGSGGNIGGGITFKIQEKVGIVADLRYYIAPKKDISWTTKAGVYVLSIWEKYGWYDPYINITQDDIDTFLQDYGELVVTVNPSFFRVAFGLQFRF